MVCTLRIYTEVILADFKLESFAIKKPPFLKVVAVFMVLGSVRYLELPIHRPDGSGLQISTCLCLLRK